MTTSMTPREFHAADGVEDWRALGNAASAFFRTGTFAKGVELLEVIGDLAEAANHHPDVDLRYRGVFVTVTTHEVGGLSERDLDLARKISSAAQALEIPADPTVVQDVQITIDASTGPDVMPFWEAVMAYQGGGDEDVIDPHSRGPSLWFQETDSPRPDRNRIHMDVWVPHDEAEARVAAALAAGGRLVSDAHAPSWWTLADAEGNEVDIATWLGRS